MQSLIPSPAWSFVACAGLIGWIASAGLLAWRGFHPDGTLSRRSAGRWLAIVAGFYALWVFGVTML